MKSKPAAMPRRRSVAQCTYDFLEREGCSPEFVPDYHPHFKQVAFQFDDGSFLAGVDEQDPDFLDVSLSLDFDPAPDEVTALRVANAVQDTTKLVKIGLCRDPRVLSLHAPVLLRGQRPTRDLLRRCVSLLRYCATQVDVLLRGRTRASA